MFFGDVMNGRRERGAGDECEGCHSVDHCSVLFLFLFAVAYHTLSCCCYTGILYLGYKGEIGTADRAWRWDYCRYAAYAYDGDVRETGTKSEYSCHLSTLLPCCRTKPVLLEGDSGSCP